MGNEGFLYHIVDRTWAGEQVTQWEFVVLLEEGRKDGIVWAVDRGEALRFVDEKYPDHYMSSVRPKTIAVE